MYVNVRQVFVELDDPSDEGIEGLYKIDFEQDVSDVSIAELAGWALDVFHCSQGIGCLDDFEITVLSDTFEVVEQAADYQCGLHNDDGSVHKVSGEPRLSVG